MAVRESFTIDGEGKRGLAMERTCVDCALNGCEWLDGQHPAFCPGEEFDLEGEPWLQDRLANPANKAVLQAAAVSAATAHDNGLSRLEETIIMARGLGVKKIGIAACVSLAAEARAAAKVFRAQGFEVTGAICKVGSIRYADAGVSVEGRSPDTVVCNPMYQAKMLNDEHTDLNVVMGLCAGHDALFLKYADALCTVLAVKDFKFDHNSIRALRPHDESGDLERLSNGQ